MWSNEGFFLDEKKWNAHRATTSKGEGISGKMKPLDACHGCELGRFQACQTVLPDVEPFEASQCLEDRGLDRHDVIV